MVAISQTNRSPPASPVRRLWTGRESLERQVRMRTARRTMSSFCKDDSLAFLRRNNATRAVVCPFLAAPDIPYSQDAEESRRPQKVRQNSEVESPPARRAADRPGIGGTAESRDQSRRCRSRLGYRPTAAARQFKGPALRRRSR